MRQRGVLGALLVLVAAGAVCGFPLLREDAGTMCSALEKRWVPIPVAGGATYLDQMMGELTAAALKGFQQASKGALAKDVMRRVHPGWPVEVACGVEYWRTFLPQEGESVHRR